jgi:hypothetical protein
MEKFVKSDGCRRMELDQFMDGDGRNCREEDDELCDRYEKEEEKEMKREKENEEDDSMAVIEMETMIPVLILIGEDESLKRMMDKEFGREMIKEVGYVEWIGRSRRMYDDSMTNGLAVWDLIVRRVCQEKREIQAERTMERVVKRKKMTAETGIRRMVIGKQQPDKKDETVINEELKDLWKQLERGKGQCASCVRYERTNTEHELFRCGNSRDKQTKKEYTALKGRIRARKTMTVFSGYMKCFLPQSWCQAWERKKKGWGYQRRTGRKCQFPDVVLSGLVVAMENEKYAGELEKRMREQIQSLDVWKRENILKYIGQRRVWRGMETSVLFWEYARHLNEVKD